MISLRPDGRAPKEVTHERKGERQKTGLAVVASHFSQSIPGVPNAPACTVAAPTKLGLTEHLVLVDVNPVCERDGRRPKVIVCCREEECFDDRGTFLPGAAVCGRESVVRTDHSECQFDVACCDDVGLGVRIRGEPSADVDAERRDG